MKILGLMCSASGCERNWSTFEAIHTKKRNRLEPKKLNDLVFVQYNQKLRERLQSRKEKPGFFDPVCLDELDADNEWLVETEDPVFAGEDLTWAQVEDAAYGSTPGEGSSSTTQRRRTGGAGGRIVAVNSMRSRRLKKEKVIMMIKLKIIHHWMLMKY
ncbi:uncharacterized protein LOC131246307 [Magnolia sinica]|uniref:uncharacterized protein LOC131246307 n=1 Tax=Magnolia sinica TaxID=86752 RepID=UPI00265A7733|nr:uncharacterized protein LOC131246307 [Magnolia sinica]